MSIGDKYKPSRLFAKNYFEIVKIDEENIELKHYAEVIKPYITTWKLSKFSKVIAEGRLILITQ